jgi:chemotaxis protein CheZ
MPVQRKVFRVEEMGPVVTPAAHPAVAAVGGNNGGPASNLHQQEVLRELKALRDLIERRESAFALDAALKSDDLRELRDETSAIARAISRTKQEIAALQASDHGGSATRRAARELDAVVEDTERATQKILDAAEAIDEAANSLSASLKNGQEQSLALDIQDRVIGIFEACNFQDLSGQRISKVLATLKFVEDHIARMMEIWGGIRGFKSTEAVVTGAAHDSRLVHGPKLNGDSGHVTQSDIDALFASK